MERHGLAWAAVGVSAAIHAVLLLWGPVWDAGDLSDPSGELGIVPPVPPAAPSGRAMPPPVTAMSDARPPTSRAWVEEVALRPRGRVSRIGELSSLRVDEGEWDRVVRGVAAGDVERTELPILLHGPRPPYPRRSRELGEQGTVVLAILVGDDGRVRDCGIFRSSGHRLLDESALRTARDRWRFRPSLRSGSPVPQWVRVPVEFRIDEGWPGR